MSTRPDDDEDATVRAPADLDEATRVDAPKPPAPEKEEDDPTKVVPKKLGTYSQAHAALKYKPRAKDDDEEASIVVRAARKVRQPVPMGVLILVLLTLAFMVVRLLRDTYGW